MNEKRQKQYVAQQIMAIALIVMLLIAPALVYIATFGSNISSNHTRWGEMGSAMSGIYTPILSILTLLVLIAQARLQNQINKHEFDQAYLQEARSDIEYYLEQLNSELSKVQEDSTTVREFLHTAFEFADLNEIRSERLLQIAREFNRRFPRVFGIWSAIYPIIEGLRTPNCYPYLHNFEAAKQMIVMLSCQTCVALDRYMVRFRRPYVVQISVQPCGIQAGKQLYAELMNG